MTSKPAELPSPSAASEPVPDLAPSSSDVPLVALSRIRPERREWRFYRIEIWPDLFGGVLLARRWGRIGSEGRLRFDFYLKFSQLKPAQTHIFIFCRQTMAF